MSRYRRARTGSTYFFTLVSFRRQPILCLPPIRAALRRAVQDVRIVRPFDIDAWVLMPDHLHCIWTLPDGDLDYSTRWALIKNSVSRFAGITTPYTGHPSPSRIKHRDAAIWQRRFFEHRIRDDLDFERHADYVHFNPVRHGHADSAIAWPFSTFHRFVRTGIYPADWGGTAQAEMMQLE
ncbi:transposase [Massilia sp. Dwa41.01b]|uniref:REP-associated tyrosine transposase n=1 Tax=unclassified Massilia TaxID=2609279 RepID=UPI00160416F5|nr:MULTISPECIES: transposase [unclassified Massilia]QNA90124.1 transposase [Massilia sp. Dwa41.01b]QNB01014.1 transposase [Massilia sp. Se16.2.3]